MTAHRRLTGDWRILRRAVAALCLLGLAAMPAVPAGAQDTSTDRLVTVRYGDQAGLAELAGRLDVWEVDHAQQTLLALVGPAERAWLAVRGFAYQVEARPRFDPFTIPSYACYRTVDELYGRLEDWAAQYPHLAELKQIGESYEGRPLWVIRLTNRGLGGEKPVLFVIANIHGRELITPETAAMFVQRLLTGYGTDPDITWLLDYQVIDVLLSANPDGHVKNEPGEPWSYWRKNTQRYDPPGSTCPVTQHGVDLNRNSSYKWGYGGDDWGSSGNACYDTYRGPAPASEPETIAVQDYMRSIFPDQRGELESSPAPLTSTGVFISLHSYGDLVLWPWGWTGNPSPNAAQLDMLGRKLAGYNGYVAQQAMELYPTVGTTDDWAYAELGVAAYTFEIGSSLEGFYPGCNRYDALVEPNVQALLYAAKAARSPYQTPFGPDVLDLSHTFTVTHGAALTVGALIDASGGSGQPVVSATLSIDVPPWQPGAPLALAATDGAFDAEQERVEITLPSLALAPGRHRLYVLGCDASGHCGPISAAFLWVVLPTFLPLFLR